MKIGELYYGVSIPQSEFNRIEQQLKRFETAMKQAGGREIARSLRDTGKAATETSTALAGLNKSWITLQNQYATNAIGTQKFVEGSRSIQSAIGDEIGILRAKGQEVTSLEALQTRVTKTAAAEQERLTRATREQALAAQDATYTNTRYAESSRLLADRLRQAQMAISNIAADEKAGLITKTEALRLFRLQQEELLRLRTAYQTAGIAAAEMARATISINTAVKGVSGNIESLRLKTEGFNTSTLEGVKLSDSLTKAWLIGLGPQGYRLYLVMDVLKETMTGVSASVRGAKNAFLALVTVMKVGVIGTLLAFTGAIIAGLNQMLKIEDIMADVRKTTNLTGAEIQTLTDAFRSLSVQLPITVGELGEIAVAAGQFGIRGTKNIFDFTKAIAELELAVNDLGDDPATKIVRFLNVMGISLDRAGEATIEISGILNELENNTAATAGEILHMASGLAQLGIVANVSVRDVLAMSAGLTSMGVNAELAGSNLTKMFVEVVGDIAKGTDAVNMWAAAAGMSRDEFVALTRESNGFSKAFRTVAVNLGAAGLSAEELTIALENLGITNIRERRIMLSLAAGWQSFSDAVEVANDEVATADSVQRELAFRLGTTNVQVQLLKNRFSAMAQIVGEYVLPRFASLIDGGNEGGRALAYFGAAVVTVFEALMALGSALKASWLGIKSLGLYVVGALAGMTTGLNSWSTVLERTMQRWRGVFQDVDWTAMITPGGAYTELNRIWYNVGNEMAGSMEAGFFDSNAAAGFFAEAEKAAFAAADALATYNEWRPRDTWNEVFQKLLLEMPEMADAIQRLREEAERDLDPALFDTMDEAGSKSGQTIESLIAELYALLAAIDRLKPVMDELEQEYDVNAEKVKALQTAITKLVMEFGLSADSPELRALIDMFLEFGGALRELGDAIEKELKGKEDFTSSWTTKMVFLVESGGLDANAVYQEFENARDKLRARLTDLANEPNRDMRVVISVQAQLADVEAAMDAIRDYTFVDMGLSFDFTMDGSFNADEARELADQLERMTSVWAEWDNLVGDTNDPLKALYNELWDIATAGGIAADNAERLLEAFGRTHFPDVPTNQRIFSAQPTAGDRTLAVGAPGSGETFVMGEGGLSEALLQRIESYNVAAEQFNRITREAPTPIEALTTALQALAEGEDAAAHYAKRLLDDLKKFVVAEEAAESLKKLTEAQEAVAKLTGEAVTPLRAAVTEYEKFRDAALEAKDSDLAANWQTLIDTLLRFETLDTAGYADTMREAQAALAGGEVKDDLMRRLQGLTQLGEGYEDIATEARAAMVALQEYQSVSAAVAAQEQFAADMFKQRQTNYEKLQEAIHDITAALAPELTALERQIQKYEEIAFLMGGMGVILEPYIQKLKDKAAAENEAASNEAFLAATERVASLMGNGRTAIQSYILELENLKKTYPKLAAAIDALIAKLKEYEAAKGADDPLKDFRDQLSRLQGKTANPFNELIKDMIAAQGEGEKFNAELAEMIKLAGELSGAWVVTQAIEEFADELDVALFAARKVFDLMQDGNWTNGNELLSAFYEIGAAVVSMIPVIGPALGKIVSMVGEFVNAIIGDMSNGMRQVKQQVDDLAAGSKFIGPELAKSLTATERVSRGGLLGWLGFTKEAVNEELTGLRVGIAESFGGALKSGITAALQGDQDWKTKLEEGLKDAIMDALLNSFIEAALLTAGLSDFINEFTSVLLEDGADAAAAYAARHMDGVVDRVMEGAEILVDAMTGYGFARPAAPGEEGSKDDFFTPMDDPNWFSLPTATPGIITATPAWVDNLGMHFAKFGMYVDRLVDEGITVNVNGGGGTSSGVTAQDLRLAR